MPLSSIRHDAKVGLRLDLAAPQLCPDLCHIAVSRVIHLRQATITHDVVIDLMRQIFPKDVLTRLESVDERREPTRNIAECLEQWFNL
jgi:hypothetical protein